MDFNKFTQQASSFMNNQSGGASSNPNNQSNEGHGIGTNLNQNQSTDPNAQSAATGNTAPQSGMGGTNTNTNAGNEDYGDKGLDFLEKKSGHTLGRDTNEKITDGARGFFEKATGKKVDAKYSN